MLLASYLPGYLLRRYVTGFLFLRKLPVFKKIRVKFPVILSNLLKIKFFREKCMAEGWLIFHDRNGMIF